MLVNYIGLTGSASAAEFISVTTDSIRVFSTPDLYNISTIWATEYNKVNSGAKISVISVSDAGTVETLTKKGHLGFISGDVKTGFNEESFSKLLLGRDIIVPVINSNNPYLNDIIQKGISPGNMLLYLSGKDSKKWGTLLNDSQSATANFYYVDDLSITEGITDFLGSDIQNIEGIKTGNSSELLYAIQKDQYAIGFCRLINVIDPQKETLIENITLLPIDRNSNGTMDYNEKIYSDYNNFSRGVWIGKYPRELVSNIYSVTSNQIYSESETTFLKWIINEGQQFLYSNGYSDLLMSERAAITDKLYETQVYSGVEADSKSVFGTFLIFVIGLVLAGFIVDFAVRYFRKANTSQTVKSSVLNTVLNTKGLNVPGGLFFDKTHTWAFMEQNGYVKVGMDDFLQHITGTITRIKMKNEGEIVKKGDHILSIIQNGKQLNLYAPISGTIREKNSLLDINASLVNSSPYNEGWVYRIEPANWHRENQLLFMAERHREFITNEFSRIKDFLATALMDDKNKYAQVILQDGGELVDNALSNLGPELWEEFQSKFIDPSRQVWFHELF